MQTMEVKPFSAQELFQWLVSKEDFLLLDVRNDEEFGRFKVEGPYPIDMRNVPYMEFIEHEEASVAKVPKGKKLRIVCAKEGSSKYVGDILLQYGHTDVGNLKVGIRAWGNLLAPIQVARAADWQLVQFRRPGKASCSYGLLYGEEMMVFDPAKDIDFYQRFAADNGCRITRTVETHRQADYISGSYGLHQAAGAEIVAPEPDFSEAVFDYTPAVDGAVLDFGGKGPAVEIIHTPGHTPGSTCYRIDGRYLVTGDTVFIASIGRPDLGGKVAEWSELLFGTLRDKILKWDRNITVLPGHYMSWNEADADLVFQQSLGAIIEANPAVYIIDNPDDFVAFIEANMRPQPEAYAKIRQINAGLVTVDEDQQDVMDLGKNECAASAMVAAGT
jgi:glyoxylase-like metal-dependent hydrolase (beta-lactamase superfamily II)/rhodanese-related sulfurtransferase